MSNALWVMKDVLTEGLKPLCVLYKNMMNSKVNCTKFSNKFEVTNNRSVGRLWWCLSQMGLAKASMAARTENGSKNKRRSSLIQKTNYIINTSNNNNSKSINSNIHVSDKPNIQINSNLKPVREYIHQSKQRPNNLSDLKGVIRQGDRNSFAVSVSSPLEDEIRNDVITLEISRYITALNSYQERSCTVMVPTLLTGSDTRLNRASSLKSNVNCPTYLYCSVLPTSLSQGRLSEVSLIGRDG